MALALAVRVSPLWFAGIAILCDEVTSVAGKAVGV